MNIKEIFQKYWLYLLLVFVTLFLALLSLITVVKLKQIQPVAPTVPQRVPQAAEPVTTAAPIPSKTCAPLSFSLEVKASESASLASLENTPPECTALSATPSEGTVPLTVKFTGGGEDKDGKVATFEFSFGDGSEQVIEKKTATARSIETQDISHTYTKAGNYTASLKVKDENGASSPLSESCQVIIAVGGPLGAPGESTPEATETAIPLPEVPEAGGFLPTILTILGGGIIILLGVLL